jgi:SAM domain (Sterile alpha motif).
MLVELVEKELEGLGVANKFHRRKIMKKIGVAKAAK